MADLGMRALWAGDVSTYVLASRDARAIRAPPANRSRRMPPKGTRFMGGHGVNWLEHTSPWVLGYLWTGNRLFLDEPLAWHRAVEEKSMQPNGVIVSDEFIGPRGAFRMSETCDVAGTLWAKNLHLAVSGEGYLGDQVERAAFNAGPATTSRDFQTHVYLQSPNRIDSKLPAHGHAPYAKTHGPLCCTAALTRIIPLFLTNLWMATDDNGLAFTSYAPSKVTALVADKQTVELTCKTDYPFNESIEIAVKPQSGEVKFPLLLRMPAWCRRPSVKLNGSAMDVKADAKQFVRLDRAWKEGDTVRLEFPMEVRVESGQDTNSKPASPYATVSYGPLLFALPIAEKDINTPATDAKWNYALASGAGETKVERGAMPAKWDWPTDSPLKLRAKGIRFDWQPTHRPYQPLPSQPVTEGAAEDVLLVPYGCTRLRISMFPVMPKLVPLPATLGDPATAPARKQ